VWQLTAVGCGGKIITTTQSAVHTLHARRPSCPDKKSRVVSENPIIYIYIVLYSRFERIRRDGEHSECGHGGHQSREIGKPNLLTEIERFIFHCCRCSRRLRNRRYYYFAGVEHNYFGALPDRVPRRVPGCRRHVESERGEKSGRGNRRVRRVRRVLHLHRRDSYIVRVRVQSSEKNTSGK